jgi:NADPH:quinone reductase-like Zn-dependent oxidoreductase
MRAVQFNEFGDPEVLQIVEVPEPHAGPGQIRIVVNAVGVNPMDWKIRQGFMGGDLPQGTGLEAAGVVDEVGDDVTDVTAGDEVFGPTSDGMADFALLTDYARIPATLDFAGAAALPVAVETAVRGLDELGVASGQTLLINGGAGAVGTAAIQFAVERGARVLVTASESNFARLHGYGAEPTTYGEGLADRVAELAGGEGHAIDRVFDMSPGGALAELVAIAGDEPSHVLTISDFANAEANGVRVSGGPGSTRRWDALDHAATLVEQGKLTVPVQQAFDLERVAEAEAMSQVGHLSGKLIVLVD